MITQQGCLTWIGTAVDQADQLSVYGLMLGDIAFDKRASLVFLCSSPMNCLIVMLEWLHVSSSPLYAMSADERQKRCH